MTLVAFVCSVSMASHSEAYVYWADPGARGIGQTNLDGSGCRTALDEIRPPASIALDGSHIYWSNQNQGDIGRADLDGGNIVPAFVADVDSFAPGLAADANYVYWTTTGDISPGGGMIGRASVDGAVKERDFITGANGPIAVAANGSSLFWANNNFAEGGASIGVAAADGSGPDQYFIPGARDPSGVAAGLADVYWANAGRETNSIGHASIDGSAVDQVFIDTGEFLPSDVAVAGDQVYWTSFKLGRDGRISREKIMRANLDGTETTQVIATGGAGIAVDPGASELPSRDFEGGATTIDRRRGTATQAVTIPAAGSLVLFGEGVKQADVDDAPAGELTLPVRAIGKARKHLRRVGHVDVEIFVSFTPSPDGCTITKNKVVRLVKRDSPARPIAHSGSRWPAGTKVAPSSG